MRRDKELNQPRHRYPLNRTTPPRLTLTMEQTGGKEVPKRYEALQLEITERKN